MPRTQSWTWSIAALAADAALEAPRASMIAAPRLATVGMNSSAIHCLVVDRVPGRASPPTFALTRSGYWVVEWLPQIVMLVISRHRGAACLRGELGDRAVVVEPHHRGEALARDVGGVRLRDQAVGVGRVADDENPDVVRRAGVDRLALGLEDPAVRLQQVGALHALAARAGRRPAARRCSHRTPAFGIVVDVDPGEQREGAVVELHRRALGGLDRIGDLEQAQVHRGVGPEHLAAGDPEEQRVADLARGAGDGDVDGVGSRACSS